MHRDTRVVLIYLAVTLLLGTVALSQSTLGNMFKLGSADESAFPASSTTITGALMFGTDAGKAYFNNGVTWSALAEDVDIDAGGQYCATVVHGGTAGTCNSSQIGADSGYFLNVHAGMIDAGRLYATSALINGWEVAAPAWPLVAPTGTAPPPFGFSWSPTAGVGTDGTYVYVLGSTQTTNVALGPIVAYLQTATSSVQVGSSVVTIGANGGSINLSGSLTSPTASTAVKVNDAEGLQLTGVAHASLSTPTSNFAGTSQWDTTHQRHVVTDGGAWQHLANIEDLDAGGEFCAGPGGSNTGLCWAGAYSATTLDAGAVLLTAASGANAVLFATNGARLDLGTGASDYFSSNGTALDTPALLNAAEHWSTATGQYQFACTANDTCRVLSNVANGAAAVAINLIPSNALTTAGALSLQVNSDSSTSAFAVGYDGAQNAVGKAWKDFTACGATGAPAGQHLWDTIERIMKRCSTYEWVEPAPHPVETRHLSSMHTVLNSNTFAYSAWATNPAITDTGAASNAYNTTSNRSYRFINTGTGDTAASKILGVDPVYSGMSPRFEARLQMPATVTTMRLWWGFSNADMSASDATNGNSYCMVRYSTAAGDAVFQLCTSDATTASCTAFATAAPVANKPWRFAVELTAASCVAYAVQEDGTEEWVSKTTNIPAETANPAKMMVAHVTITNISGGVSRGLGVNALSQESQ